MATNRIHIVKTESQKAVNPRRKRLYARHVSTPIRALVLDLFDRLESHDAVADELNQPGITSRTVSEIVDLHNLRKGMATERSMAMFRIQRKAGVA